MAIREFPGLTPARAVPGAPTETAQRFLASAYDSVVAVLESLDVVRQARRQLGGSIRGRLPANEEDLLRAAVVFTGAGLDAALKQLIRDVLPLLLDINEQAHVKFETFTVERISAADSLNAKAIARYLVAEHARSTLIEDYVDWLTGSSLQSAGEVQRVAGALGIENAALRKRINELRPLFIARNEISHELDLQRPERAGDRARRTRSVKSVKQLCYEGLEVGQLIINASDEVLTSGLLTTSR